MRARGVILAQGHVPSVQLVLSPHLSPINVQLVPVACTLELVLDNALRVLQEWQRFQRVCSHLVKITSVVELASQLVPLLLLYVSTVNLAFTLLQVTAIVTAYHVHQENTRFKRPKTPASAVNPDNSVCLGRQFASCVLLELMLPLQTALHATFAQVVNLLLRAPLTAFRVLQVSGPQTMQESAHNVRRECSRARRLVNAVFVILAHTAMMGLPLAPSVQLGSRSMKHITLAKLMNVVKTRIVAQGDTNTV